MIFTRSPLCRGPRLGGKNRRRWTPHAISFKKRWCSAESMTRPINGSSRAKPGCTLTNFSMRRRNEARDPPPDLELDHSHALGAGGNRALGGRCVFWQRRRQPFAEPAIGKPVGADDRRQGGVASAVNSLAGNAGKHNRASDPRGGACWHGASFYRGGGAGRSAHRFLLGPQNFAE